MDFENNWGLFLLFFLHFSFGQHFQSISKCWFGSYPKQTEMMLRLSWEESETMLKHCWDEAGTMLRQCCVYAMTMLRRCWDDAEMMLRWCWDNAETTLKECWDMLRWCKDDAETMLRQCWDDAETMGGFICSFSLFISFSITLQTSKFRNHQFTNILIWRVT